MSNNKTPATYGQEYGSTLRNRWNSAFGLAVRRMVSIVWPGVPPEAFLGFTSIAGSVNALQANTADPPVNNSFGEAGMFQVEIGMSPGPYPNPDPNAHYNNWGRLANNPLVIRALGHAASMVPDAWKHLPEDQAAVGLVNLRQYVNELAGQLPASIRPTRYDTLYAVAMAFTAFSAGTNGARGLFTRYAAQLAAIPEASRWQQLVWLLARDIQNGFQPPGGAGRHGNVAYDALRTMQKLEAGRQLALVTGGNVAWFDMGAETGEVIKRAAFGESVSGLAAIAEPMLRAQGVMNKVVAVVAGLGLLALGYVYVIEPRLNPQLRSTPPTIRAGRDTLPSSGRYRVMRSGESAPCKDCGTSTKWTALSEEAGERGYVFTPACAKHLPALRRWLDSQGYVEHYRENPSREVAGWDEHGEKCLGGGAAQQYDHDKLVLAIHNRGYRGNLSGLSYGDVYAIARRLKIRA